MESYELPKDPKEIDIVLDPFQEQNLLEKQQFWGYVALKDLSEAYRLNSLAESSRLNEFSDSSDAVEDSVNYFVASNEWMLRAKYSFATALNIDSKYSAPNEDQSGSLEIIDKEKERELNNLFSNFKRRYFKQTIGLAIRNIENGNERVILKHETSELLPSSLASNLGETVLEEDVILNKLPDELSNALLKYINSHTITKLEDSVVSEDEAIIELRKAKNSAAYFLAALDTNSIRNRARNAPEVTNGHAKRKVGEKQTLTPYQELQPVFMKDNNQAFFEDFINVCLVSGSNFPEIINKFNILDDQIPPETALDPSKFVNYFKSRYLRKRQNDASVNLKTKLIKFLRTH